MLIVLDLPAEALARINRDLLRERIRELLYAHRTGRNLIVVGRQAYDWVRRNVALSGLEESLLNRIGKDAAQTGNLESEATKFIRIAPANASLCVLGSREISVPIDYRHFSEVMLCPSLIVEDIAVDATIYRAIFQAHAARPAGYPVNFDPEHGGGARIVRATDAKIAQRKIVCTVLDSDRRAPIENTGKLGSFLSELSDPSWPLLFAFELPCMEIENCASIEMYQSVFGSTHGETISILMRIDEAEDALGVQYSERFWLFFDVKKGLGTGEMEGDCDRDIRAWIDSRIKISGGASQTARIAGFGRDAIQRLLNSRRFHVDLGGLVKSARWQYVFGQVMSEIYWILIAPMPQYVI